MAFQRLLARFTFSSAAVEFSMMASISHLCRDLLIRSDQGPWIEVHDHRPTDLGVPCGTLSGRRGAGGAATIIATTFRSSAVCHSFRIPISKEVLDRVGRQRFDVIRTYLEHRSSFLGVFCCSVLQGSVPR